MSGARPRVTLVKDLAARIAAGHPWVYSAALSAPSTLAPGTLVDVQDKRGRVVARGFFDPAGPIGVRVLAREAAEIDAAWVRARVASACAIRAAAPGLDSDAVRLLHGEGDFVPGVVLDRYGATGVARFDGEASAAFWRPWVPEIVAACGAAGFPLERLWGRDRGGRGEALFGDAPPPEVEIREGPARYLVDVVHGQKTGFFLDQRANRALVARLAAGLDVLNLFAYTGGFSVAAALAGARRTTSVDVAAPAMAAAAKNLSLNGIPLAAHDLVAADVFAFLAAAGGRRWDIVVCDPPSFAPRAQAVPKALSAYRELNRAAASVVAPGGLLATASCSSHVTPDAFLSAVHAGITAAARGEGARILDIRGAGPDHPVPPAFPEGRYLKFVLLYLP